MASYMYNNKPHPRDNYGRPSPPLQQMTTPSPYQPHQQVSPRLQPSPTFHSQPYQHSQQYQRDPSPQFRQIPSSQRPLPPHLHDPSSFAPNSPPPHQQQHHHHLFGSSPANSRPPPTPTSPPADAIKCSSCSAWVHLDDLGEHVCKSVSSSTNGGTRGYEDANSRGLRVDVQAAGSGGKGNYGQTSLRSPMFPGQHLEATPPHTPHTLGSSHSHSRPTSPAHSAHSAVSSNSSASSSVQSAGSSRMPFFERYNKLVGTTDGPGGGGGNGDAGASLGGNMAGVGMRNLDVGGRSPRSPNFPSASSPYEQPGINRNRSPSPNTANFPSSRSTQDTHLRSPALDPSPIGNSFRQTGYPEAPPSHRQPSPSPSQSSSHSNHSRQQPLPPPVPHLSSQQQHSQSSHDDYSRSRTISIPQRSPSNPPISPLPSAPSSSASYSSSRPPIVETSGLARSASNSSSLHSAESAYIAYDRRDTLKPSSSTAALAKMSRSPSIKGSLSGKSEGAGSLGSLDALEDLLLMAREGATDDMDDQEGHELLDEFMSTSSRKPNREEEEDLNSTPRAPSKMSSSKSVPSSLSQFSSKLTGLTTSGSTPNLSAHLATPTCTTCSKKIAPSDVQKAGDGQAFCKGCYAERYLPKCRKCRKAIEGGAVTSSDGKVLGKVSAVFLLVGRELELMRGRIVVSVSSSLFLVLLVLEEFPIWRFLRLVSYRDPSQSLPMHGDD